MTDSRNSASYLEIIIGPMYSKKSSRLVEIYNQCNFCKNMLSNKHALLSKPKH